MFSSMEGITNCFTTTAAAAITDHRRLYQLEERENSSDNSGDNSPSSTAFASSIPSPKRSRRAIQKKVVTVPIKDVEGSRFKGDCTPPSDSWAWRKYGQKPIKGSPYPRGYYRCSSSKGCPARKQVERSRADPTMLVITYSYEHNHAWPTSRNRHNSAAAASTSATTSTTPTPTPTATVTAATATIPTPLPNVEINTNHHHHHHLGGHDQPLMVPTDELTWLTSDSNTSSFFASCGFGDLDMAKIFPLGEEEDALFADLGELPECSVVFGQPPAGMREKEEQQQECGFNW